MLPQRPYPKSLFMLMRTCADWWTEQTELHSRPAVVMVSGGLDSLCLWAVLELCLKEGWMAFPEFRVAHIHYPYRRGAAAETAWLQTQAQALKRGWDCYEPNEKTRDPITCNREDQARQWRFEFYDMLQKKYPQAFFMLARHANDQVEDFWLRVFRHPTPWTWHAPNTTPFTQVYPLATVSRRSLQDAYQQVGWPAFFDHTNTALQFRRNVIRHQLQQLQVPVNTAQDPRDLAMGFGLDFETLCNFVPLAQTWTTSLQHLCEEKLCSLLGLTWRHDSVLNLSALSTHARLVPVAIWEWLRSHTTHKVGINTTLYRQLVDACRGIQFPKTFVFPALGTVVVRAGRLTLESAEVPGQVDQNPVESWFAG